MRTSISIVLGIAMVGVILYVNGVSATNQVGSFEPQEVTLVSASAPHALNTQNDLAVELSARAWAVFDLSTGHLLLGEHVDEELPIASLTKLFTAYAVLAANSEEVWVHIVHKDLLPEGSSGKLIPHERYQVTTLLFPLLLTSSNDAAEAIRRALDHRYTDALKILETKLTLAHTHIADSSGLAPTSISTVRELARFYAHLASTYPSVLTITKLPMYLTETKQWVNNNPLRAEQTFLHGKHGYTPEANFTYVGAFRTEESDTPIGVVVLGSQNLADDVRALLYAWETHSHTKSAIIRP